MNYGTSKLVVLFAWIWVTTQLPTTIGGMAHETMFQMYSAGFYMCYMYMYICSVYHLI
jgi:hypothetical protein